MKNLKEYKKLSFRLRSKMKHIIVFLIIPLIFVLGCSTKNQDDQIMTETSTNTEYLVSDFVESHSSPPDSETEIIEESDSKC